MKRYTLIFQPIDSTFAASGLRDVVEQVMLRLHPRITYKMGQAFQGVDGKLLVEITMDGKRELLDQTLKSMVWHLPVRFESLRWGWMVENEDIALLIPSTAPLENDPLAGVQPLDGEAEFRLSKWHSQGRYIALMTSTLVLILVLIANAIHTRSPILEGLYIVFFAIFMFFLNETPIDIRVYAEKITIRSHGLEVSYWLLNKPVGLDWEMIWGLDYTNSVCMLLSEGRKTRFLLSERFGCKDKSVVLKTIVTRASLSYVEGNFQKLIYRKPDAGNGHTL